MQAARRTGKEEEKARPTPGTRTGTRRRTACFEREIFWELCYQGKKQPEKEGDC